MKITELTDLDRKLEHLPLLLDADPSEEMVMRYLPRGRMFVLEGRDEHYSPGVAEVLGEIVVVDLGESRCEIKNMAVAPHARGRGYGRMLIEHVASVFSADCAEMLVGTSDSGCAFYEKCGFSFLHKVPKFFTKNYREPIYENGKRCVDMTYLRRVLQHSPLLSICYLQTHSLY